MGRLLRSWERIDGVVGAVSLGGVVAPDFALNEPRSRDNQATIARRSWFFIRLDPPSDGDLMVAHNRASDEDRMLQKPPLASPV